MAVARKVTRKGNALSNRVHIYVQGCHYETMKRTLKTFPETLLGSGKKRAEYYCPYRNAYYFDRSCTTFESILYFYQSHGKLYRPPDTNVDDFIEECNFFQLPDWAIEELKKKEGKDIEEQVKAALFPPLPNSSEWRRSMFEFFEYPFSSRWSRIYFFFCLVLIIISIAVSCIHRIFKGIETHRVILKISINLFFFIEFLTRLVISPGKLQLLKRVSTWFEILALTSSMLLLIRSNENFIYGFNSCFQSLRIFILFTRTSTMRVIPILFKVTLGNIVAFAVGFFVYILFGAVIIYMLETIPPSSTSQFTSATLKSTATSEKGTSQFTSVPESAWWAIQTATTVGYGNIVPVTSPGKVFASIYMVIVITTLWVLLVPIVGVFEKYIPSTLLIEKMRLQSSEGEKKREN